LKSGRKKRKKHQAVISTPRIIKGKGATSVPSTVALLQNRRRREKQVVHFTGFEE
jgi:hypothetical protein